MAPGKRDSSFGGGKQPLKIRREMETNLPPDSPPNSSDPGSRQEDTLHSSQPGSISKVMRVQTEHLKCTACLEYPQMEVFQCSNGHLVCDRCSAKITTCPVCRAIYPEMRIRNRVAETDLDNMTYNCSHRDYGCLMTNIPRNRRNAHDIQCEHNPTPTGVKYVHLSNSPVDCQLRICPYSIMQDPQHSKDVIEHLTVRHGLPHKKIRIGEKIIIQFRLPTITSIESIFYPVELFEVCAGLAYKTIGYYLLIRRVEMPQQGKILSWAVVGFNSASENLNGGGKITVKFSIKAKTDPDRVAKDGDECVPNLSWTVKSKGLHEWKEFVMMPNECHREQSSFSLPLMFLSDFYVQQDNKCELFLSFGPLVD